VKLHGGAYEIFMDRSGLLDDHLAMLVLGVGTIQFVKFAELSKAT
jgi:hypothetical protein